MKAYSYIRFSTPQQAAGDSFRRQLDMSQSYAAKHNLEIDDTLRMTDLGKSAYKGEHLSEGALGAFLKAVESHQVEHGSYLLVESLDRLSRAAVPKALRLFLTLLEHGIRIVTLADERCYSEESVSDGFTEIIISIVIMSRAHEESQRKADRVARAWEAKRKAINEEKLTGMCPRWLKLSSDRKSFEIIAERVRVVSEMFELSAQGMGYCAIANKFNARKEPVWTTARRLENAWHFSYIAKILRNPAVIGRYQAHRVIDGKNIPVGDPVTDYFPAVVDEALFLSLQGRHRPHGRHSRHVNNLFTHLTHDGHTGHPMRYVSKIHAGRSRPWQYLVSDIKRVQPGARPIVWAYRHFEAAFLKFVTELDWRQVTQQNQNIVLQERQREETLLAAQITELDERAEKFASAIAMEEQPPALLVRKIREIEAGKKTLEETLATLRKTIRKLEQDEEHLHRNQDHLRKLIADGRDPANHEIRLRLREEIRKRVERITLYPQPRNSPRRPSFVVTFLNGCTTYASVSPTVIGCNATRLNSNPDVSGIRFQPPDEDAPSPLDGLICHPDDPGDEEGDNAKSQGTAGPASRISME